MPDFDLCKKWKDSRESLRRNEAYSLKGGISFLYSGQEKSHHSDGQHRENNASSQFKVNPPLAEPKASSEAALQNPPQPQLPSLLPPERLRSGDRSPSPSPRECEVWPANPPFSPRFPVFWVRFAIFPKGIVAGSVGLGPRNLQATSAESRPRWIRRGKSLHAFGISPCAESTK